LWLEIIFRLCTLLGYLNKPRAKTDPSVWVKNQGKDFDDFDWQNGYGAFSVNISGLSPVKTYVIDQEKHRARVSFKDEALQLFMKNGLDQHEK
jgi:hypothetical protein